jgi:hypothetical protein
MKEIALEIKGRLVFLTLAHAQAIIEELQRKVKAATK